MTARMRILASGLGVVALAVAAAYGFFVHRNQIFPYGLLKRLAHDGAEQPRAQARPEIIPLGQVAASNNATDLLGITSREGAAAGRARLVELLWGSAGLPATTPRLLGDAVELDPRWTPLTARLARSERFEIVMAHGFVSIVDLLVPEPWSGTLVFFHEGHGAEQTTHLDWIGEILNAGHAVAVFCMPLNCLNNRERDRVRIDDARLGTFELLVHNHMQFLPRDDGHPIRFFVEPVVVFLNGVLSKNEPFVGASQPEQVVMLGYSGGGWTTVLASAVDLRIRRSFAVSAGYPIFVRADSRQDLGDWEQHTPELYRELNYLELYLLGALDERGSLDELGALDGSAKGGGFGREQTHFVNLYDTCCNGGIKHRGFADAVRRRATELGGDWDLEVDEDWVGHGISPRVLERILGELEGRPVRWRASAADAPNVRADGPNGGATRLAM